MAVYIIWPERKWLDDETVGTMYDDAVENDQVALGHQRARNIEEMAAALEDAGIITRGAPPPYGGKR